MYQPMLLAPTSARYDGIPRALVGLQCGAVLTPPGCTLAQFCEQFGVVVRITTGEATPQRDYGRQAWITYTTGTDVRAVCKKLDEKMVRAWSSSRSSMCATSSMPYPCPQIGEHQMKCQPGRAVTQRIKVAPLVASDPRRVREDLEQTARLISHLDTKRGLWADEPNPYLGGM